ncbi:predicted protein [Naegleria gruberi]|uniref:Predicted protein n=1 Tax=Naegleria gruberi TaxID=5762 RepID=D2VQH8_NAEGR|nr:uncharacterized protein NAEGRDRAFT_71231 [Naegleria gruberi]EFC40952.1 predicted protein [Naegleria gruberi]|eukprot:XP_002673696.1 predicted protein [Naegleria gruberi strain NEG-M]
MTQPIRGRAIFAALINHNTKPSSSRTTGFSIIFLTLMAVLLVLLNSSRIECKLNKLGEDSITCEGMRANDTSVCSGRGACISLNNCSCSSGYEGSNCQLEISPTFCDRIINCTGHGECNIKGECECHSSIKEGFWTGRSCSSCQSEYHGEKCSSRVVGPAVISSDFKGITFYLHSPYDFIEKDVPCSSLLHPSDISKNVYGSITNIKCQYLDKVSGLFMISFGSVDYDIQPGETTIQINDLAFENEQIHQQYMPLTVNVPQNISPPKAIIQMASTDIYSSCDTITIDGSSSYSIDGKQLLYYWSLLDATTMNPVSILQGQSIFTLDSSLTAGDYIMTLYVKSKWLNLVSSTVSSKRFTKAVKPLPLLSTSNKGETIVKYTNQFPLTVKKVITPSVCQSDSDVLQVEWTKLSGSAITFSSDSYNNLFIPSVSKFGTQNYTFEVSAFYASNPSLKASTIVNIVTKSPDLILSIIQSESTKYHTTIEVDYLDPEMSLHDSSIETWTWTCLDNTSPELVNLLNNAGSTKASEFVVSSSLFSTIPSSVELKLRVEKLDGRSIEKTTTVFFGKVPPLLNILHIEPSSSILLPGQFLSIQALLYAESSSVNATWLLNGAVLQNTSCSNTTIDKTITIIIDTKQLEEGSTNVVTCIIFDKKTGFSTQSSYSFTIAVTPKPCDCTISPLKGQALETEFKFYCSNCKNIEANIDYKYGFIDDRSGSKIELYKFGDIYSSKLPAPFSGSTLTCYFEVIQTVTGASITTYQNLTISKPVISDFSDASKIVKEWAEKSSEFTSKGEFSSSFYQSATTSRTDSVLLQQLLKKLYSVSSKPVKRTIECIHGRDISGVCKCEDGWIGSDCSDSIQAFSDIQGTKMIVLRDMIYIANSTDGFVNDYYLSLLSFSIDSLLINYQLLNSKTISESLFTLNMFLEYALADPNLKLAPEIETLLVSSVESAYSYIINRQYFVDQSTNSRRLLSALKLSTCLIGRNIVVGSKKQQKTGSFYSMTVNRHTIFDMPTSIHDDVSKASVQMENYIFDFSPQVTTLFKKPFVYIFSSSIDVFSLNTKLTISQKVDSQTYQMSSLVSPIVSLKLIDLSIPVNSQYLVYEIPINKSIAIHEVIHTTLDYIEQEVRYSCGNFDDGSTEVAVDCIMLSMNDTYAVCRCKQLTNVFIMETVTTVYHSFTYVAGVVLSTVMFALCLCVTLASIFFCIWYGARKTQKVTSTSGEVTYGGGQVFVKSNSVVVHKYEETPLELSEATEEQVHPTLSATYNKVPPLKLQKLEDANSSVKFTEVDLLD